MEFFEIVRLRRGEGHFFERIGRKERLIVANQRCRVSSPNGGVWIANGGVLELSTTSGHFEVTDAEEGTVLVRLCGRWAEDVGGCGTFTVRNVPKAVERGDPTSYPKKTKLDNHYHDCDEYWIIFEGRGIAVSEGRRYEVGAGDCVATRAGDHHDFPEVYETVRAAYFETTLRGMKRRGHLYEHTHGPTLRGR
jgi:mannose-6-phosphate isomerase-like protein (cupin superfamily)